MNKKYTIIFWLLLLLPVTGILINYLYIHPAIVDAYQGNPDGMMRFLIRSLYPRFDIEKNRFDLPFFLSKGDQVIYRFVFVYYSIFFISWFSIKSIVFREKVNAFFFTKTTSRNIDALRMLFFSYFLYLSLELCHDLIVMQPMKAFYKPIFWLRIVPLPFPGYYTVFAIGTFWCLLNILIICNIRTVLFSSLSFLLFFLVQCWLFSFEKFDHGYTTFTYAFMMLPFLLEENKSKNKDLFSSWSLQLIRISLAMVYFLSALEKIFISRLSWLDAENLKGYLSLHETFLSSIIVQYDLLCVLISISTLLFQLSFILILFVPRYKWFWLTGGILFHTGTLLVMGIGHPLNPWLLVYIFFIDWTEAYNFVSGRLKNLLFSN